MGKLADNMEKVVNGIRVSASTRHRELGQMRASTCDLLARDHGQRREMAQALRTKLDRQDKDRLQVASEGLGEICAALGVLRATVRTRMGGIGADVAEASRVWSHR